MTTFTRALFPPMFSQAGALPSRNHGATASGGNDTTATDATACWCALPAACWILRLSVALMCWGLAARVLFITFTAETDIFELLLFDQVGKGILVEGEWSESVAKAVDHNGAWYYFLAGLALLLVPVATAALGLLPPLRNAAEFARRWGLLWQAPLLLAISLWTFFVPAAHAYRGGSFMAEWEVFAHFARILTPLGLIFWLAATARPRDSLDTAWQSNSAFIGEWILRIGIAVTFFIHGLEAFWHHPQFIDLVINSSNNLLNFSLRSHEPQVKQALTVIGILDFVVAVSIVLDRFRPVALWMAFWGILTACSRVTAMGWEKYPEILMRAAHAGAPLALFVYWQWGLPRKKQPTSPVSPAEEPTA